MIYRKQLFRHRPNIGEVGDCHRTAIACMLDLEPSLVPHFGLAFWEQPEKFHAAFEEWLSGRGYRTVTVAYSCTLEEVLQAQGHFQADVRYLLGGRSRNGTNHTVVGRGGRVEWDPSIDDSGIVGPCLDGHYWVTWLTPLGLHADDTDAVER